MKESMLDKTVRGDRATRLAALGRRARRRERCAHDAADARAPRSRPRPRRRRHRCWSHGASAIIDRRDVMPGAAVEAAGGGIEHFGMPVDPGNCCCWPARRDRRCWACRAAARSPKLNGFDWVLERLAAGVPVGREDIMRMGVGGLLTEIAAPAAAARRAPPRAAPRVRARPKVAALVLAAGQSRRMGGATSCWPRSTAGRWCAHAVDSGAGGRARAAGRRGDSATRPSRSRRRSASCRSTWSRNPAFAEGLSTSLQGRHRRALPDDVDGVMVCLGDMPLHRRPRHRPADRRLQPARGPRDRRADPPRQARQPGAVVRALLPGDGASWPAMSAPST